MNGAGDFLFLFLFLVVFVVCRSRSRCCTISLALALAMAGWTPAYQALKDRYYNTLEMYYMDSRWTTSVSMTDEIVVGAPFGGPLGMRQPSCAIIACCLTLTSVPHTRAAFICTQPSSAMTPSSCRWT